MKEHKKPQEVEQERVSENKPAKVRRIVIKTSIRAGQGKNRYAAAFA